MSYDIPDTSPSQENVPDLTLRLFQAELHKLRADVEELQDIQRDAGKLTALSEAERENRKLRKEIEQLNADVNMWKEQYERMEEYANYWHSKAMIKW